MRPALLFYGIWLSATAAWWYLALGPIPPWLERTRQVCFGGLSSGLPDAGGWLALASPLPMLAALLVLHGHELLAQRRRALVLLVVVPLLGVGWVGQRVARAAARPAPEATLEALPPTYPRTERPLPAFALTDQHGRTVRASDLAGRTALLTFAYAHCSTICPALIRSVKAVGQPVAVVTLDPWRDTCGSLPDLARQWDLPPGSMVLSGPVEDVSALTAALNVPVTRDPKTGEIDHPALLFVLDSQGRIAYTFLNPPPAWLEEAIARSW